MLAETVGALTREPALRVSTSMSSAERWKKWRLRGSRQIEFFGLVSGSSQEPVSGGWSGRRGRGDAISTQRARSFERQA